VPLGFVSHRARWSVAVTVAVAEAFVWYAALSVNYGIEENGEFDVAYGYGLLARMFVVSNLAFLVSFTVFALAFRTRAATPSVTRSGGSGPSR
jgi:hypothetical protein